MRRQEPHLIEVRARRRFGLRDNDWAAAIWREGYRYHLASFICSEEDAERLYLTQEQVYRLQDGLRWRDRIINELVLRPVCESEYQRLRKTKGVF